MHEDRNCIPSDQTETFQLLFFLHNSQLTAFVLCFLALSKYMMGLILLYCRCHSQFSYICYKTETFGPVLQVKLLGTGLDVPPDTNMTTGYLQCQSQTSSTNHTLPFCHSMEPCSSHDFLEANI